MTSNFSKLADLITIISGAMTILGVSGFLTWSVFRGKNGLLSEKLLSIFAYSIKSALCISLIPIIGFILYVPFMICIEFSGGNTSAFMFPNRDWPLPNYVVTIIWSMFVIPFYVIVCACIIEWSSEPIIRFRSVFGIDSDA